MQAFLEQFEFIKSKYDDGSGFWDEYRKKGRWLDRVIELSIAARGLSEEIPPLLQKFMEDQVHWDEAFKRFAAEQLLGKLKKEWHNEALLVEDITERIYISEMAFGYEKNDAFGIWFCTGAEHGVQVYGDFQGRLTRAAVE